MFQESEQLLESIFANVPAGCTDVRLGMRRYFKGTAGKDMYILTDYLYFGGDRVRVRFAQREEQREISPVILGEVIAAHGWAQGQPTRRNTTEFAYQFTPNVGQHSFGLHSQTAQVAERRHQEQVFERFA